MSISKQEESKKDKQLTLLDTLTKSIQKLYLQEPDITDPLILNEIKDTIVKAKISLPNLVKCVSNALKGYYSDAIPIWDLKEKNRLMNLLLASQPMQLSLWSKAVLTSYNELKPELKFPDDVELLQLAKLKWIAVESEVLNLYFKRDLFHRIVNAINIYKMQQKMADVSRLIDCFRVHNLFNLEDLISMMVNQDKINEVLLLVGDNLDYAKILVPKLIKKYANQAVELVKGKKWDPNLFPELIKALEKKHVTYEHKNYTLNQVEDHLLMQPRLLGYVVEEEMKKSEPLGDEAVSIVIRHKLLEGNYIEDQKTRELLEKIIQNQQFTYVENRLFMQDDYKPTEEILDPKKAGLHFCWQDFSLEFGKNVFFVDDAKTELFEKAIADLLKGKIVALDTEFLGSYHKLDERGGVSIFQMSTPENTYLFDTAKLGAIKEFCIFLENLFGSSKIVKVTHTFSSDKDQIAKNIKVSDFKGQTFVDIARVYRALFPGENQTSLAFIAGKLLGKRFSKAEQISGWSNRPLRKAQIHYAALDSFILIHLYNKLKEVKDISIFKETIRFGSSLADEPLDKESSEEEEKTTSMAVGGISVEKKKTEKKEKSYREAFAQQDGDNGIFYSDEKYNYFFKGDGEIKLVVDNMLLKLARYLRNVGIDTEYVTSNDNTILEVAEEQHRVIITRKWQIFENKKGLPCYLLRVDGPEEQYKAIESYFKLEPHPGAILSRCVKCNNSEFDIVSYDQVYQELNWEANFHNTKEFWKCTQCKQIYWEGSTYKNARKRFAELTQK